MGILRYIQCETLRRGLIKSLWTAVSLRRAIVNFHCHTHIFTLVATNTHSSRIFMHALYVAYQPLINAEVGRAYEVTRLGTLPNTFFRSTKACTLSCWRHGIFLLGGMQWIWRLWRCGKAWNMIACHRWALVVVGRSEPPSLEPSWHGLAIPGLTISTLKDDALSPTEGDDNTLLQFSRDLGEVVSHKSAGSLHHHRLSAFQVQSGMYQQPWHTSLTWWLWSFAQVGCGGRAFHRVDSMKRSGSQWNFAFEGVS